MRVGRRAVGRAVGCAQAPAGGRSGVVPACRDLSTEWKGLRLEAPVCGVYLRLRTNATQVGQPGNSSRAAQGTGSRLGPTRSRGLHPDSSVPARWGAARRRGLLLGTPT